MTVPTVLVVEHEAAAPAAWLGEALERRGVVLAVCRPYAGDPVPDPDGFSGVVVLGGSMAAWEDSAAPWLPGVRELVRRASRAEVPVLGICLGHQLATLALGGEVAPNPAGTTVAVLPICWGPDAASDPLLSGPQRAPWAVHWNNDVAVQLPPGSRVLARSPDGAVQAARLGPKVWGVQFHPEAGPAVVERWAFENGAALAEAGFDLDGYLADVRRLAPEVEASCDRLAASFVALLAAS